MTTILSLCLSLLAWVDPPGAAAAPATKTQRAELARLQKLRDSLVAARWETRRQDLAERDAWNEEFAQVRDSLETARQERSQLDLESRRLERDRATSATASPPADPSDPLDGVRRELSARLEALGGRIDRGLPWEQTVRRAKVDSVRRVLADVSAVETALPSVLGCWRAEWIRAGKRDTLRGMLPRPEGEPVQGIAVVWGGIGGWYRSEDGTHRGAMLRSAPGGGWEWREDLSDSALAAVGRGDFPVDPGLGIPEGAGFFHQIVETGWKARLARWTNFREGPLHAAALWAARLVMVLLVFLGLLVAWTGWVTHRRLRREECDPTPYESKIGQAMLTASAAESFAAGVPDTMAGRLSRLGLGSRHLAPEALEQILTASESAQQRALEHGLARLGTIGSNAPFIGLFGTVCGILDAFAALGQTGGGPQAVMTAIAEALVATAIGLAVAIPAIWVFNALQGRALELGARARELRILMVAASLDAAARQPAGR